MSGRVATEALSKVRRWPLREASGAVVEEWEPRCRPIPKQVAGEALSDPGEAHLATRSALSGKHFDRYDQLPSSPPPHHHQLTLGYRQRQRRRKKRAAQRAAQREARRSGSSSRKWWLTICVQRVGCARCGRVLRPGAEMLYRKTPRESLCLACCERDPDVRRSCRPSLRWEREKVRA